MSFGSAELSPHEGERGAWSGIVVDEGRCLVEIDGHVARLAPMPFRVLRVLLQSYGQWLSQREIIRRAAGTHHQPDTSLVRVHVHAIRKALGAHAGAVRVARRRGYMFLLDSGRR